MTDERPGLLEYLYDKEHPKRSPLLGMFLSTTLCALGHRIVMMELDTWDERWLACSVCGARFLPESMLADDYEIVGVP